METTKTAAERAPEVALDASSEIDSVAISRLIEEVRSGDSIAPASDYNRTYNRHNR
jgi:hypothetical protein